MKSNVQDFEAFAGEYQKEEKEVLVLINDATGGAGKCGNSWDASRYFLAFVDIASNELKKGDGRIQWLLSDEEHKEHGLDWPYYFKGGGIYRLKVRELLDKTVPEGMLSSYANRLMVCGVLEENVCHEGLLEILDEYRKPVIIHDETLGEFELDKDLGMFEGMVNWLGEDISASFDVDIDDKDSWTEAMNVLRALFERREQQDSEFRSFAAKELTGLANDWRQEEDEGAAEISREDFIGRISLSELSTAPDGSYTAYYDDDDMFLGHAVTVYGNLREGIESATIEG